MVVAEGLQEVEVKKVTSLLCRVITTFKVNEKLGVDQSLNTIELYRYAAYTLLKFKVVTIKEGWTDTLSKVTRKTVEKTGT